MSFVQHWMTFHLRQRGLNVTSIKAVNAVPPSLFFGLPTLQPFCFKKWSTPTLPWLTNMRIQAFVLSVVLMFHNSPMKVIVLMHKPTPGDPLPSPPFFKNNENKRKTLPSRSIDPYPHSLYMLVHSIEFVFLHWRLYMILLFTFTTFICYDPPPFVLMYTLHSFNSY